MPKKSIKPPGFQAIESSLTTAAFQSWAAPPGPWL